MHRSDLLPKRSNEQETPNNQRQDVQKQSRPNSFQPPARPRLHPPRKSGVTMWGTPAGSEAGFLGGGWKREVIRRPSMMPMNRAYVARTALWQCCETRSSGASSHLEERCGVEYYGLSYYIMLSFENGYSGSKGRYTSAFPMMQYVQCGHFHVSLWCSVNPRYAMMLFLYRIEMNAG